MKSAESTSVLKRTRSNQPELNQAAAAATLLTDQEHLDSKLKSKIKSKSMADKKSYVLDELKLRPDNDRPETLVGLIKPENDAAASTIEEEDKEHHSSPNLKGDYGSICVLLFLYVLQGIPLGLAGAIPMILQNRGVSYSEQAMLSLGSWPFSVKLLWAPLVDALFWSRFGRRKSWLVPTQYMIGITMLLVSPFIDDLMGGSERVEYEVTHSEPTSDSSIQIKHPAIYTLTAIFLFQNFLCATQDIAVDGWALTMLSRRNVIYASTCNSVGQTAGYFLGHIVLLAFESPDFCNRYLRTVPQPVGMITLAGFLYFWGIVFIVATTLVALFKTDAEHSVDERELRVANTYKALLDILKLPAVKQFVFFSLTCKVGFAITDSASGLKLIEAGVHKENMAMLAIPMIPLQIILPWVISHYTKGPDALGIFMQAYPYRLLFGIFYGIIIRWAYLARLADNTYPAYFYAIILFVYALHQITVYCMFVPLMSFFARISDPAIGGTYMTLLNTVSNLGGMWPATVSLWLLDLFTVSVCQPSNRLCFFSCPPIKNDQRCEKWIDGYYPETIFFMFIGLVWMKLYKKKFVNLQQLPLSVWKVK